jgi:DNA (cytosine-5)-methyltransferase 1
LNSRYFGIPQSRPRVFICAWLGNPTDAGNVLFEGRMPSRLTNERAAFINTSCKNSLGPIPPKLAFCLAATSGRHTGTDWSRTYIPYADAVRRLTPLECERLQGFPDHWTKLLSGIDLEKADSLRYHALGNAVSVSVVNWIAKRISKQLKSENSSPSPKRGTHRFLKESLEMWPELNSSKLLHGNISDVRLSSAKIPWPNSGITWKNEFIANNIYPSPYKPVPSDLADLVEQDRPDSRYFLSINAAEGILRRVDSQNRHLFPPLRNALERLTGDNLTTDHHVSIAFNRESSRRELHIQELAECV